MDSKVVAISAKMMDDDDNVDWGALTAEQAQDKQKELQVKYGD